MSATPIADYGLLSDRHSAALVSRDGSVDWLCFPRFDSPSILARLLDDDAGHWSVRPTDLYEVSRHYRAGSMVLDTVFRTSDGQATLSDALLVGPGNGGHRLGVGVPHMLVRQIRCTGGRIPLEVEYRPRLDYGLVRPPLSETDGGLTWSSGPERLALTTPVRLAASSDGARGGTELAEGDTLLFALQWSTGADAPAQVWRQETLAAWLADTAIAWRSWCELHQTYRGPWRELVDHSGRVLQALSYQPSGAIVAAPTTSLPEGVGGERNWDYRYSWVRDSSLTMQALWVAACPDEAGEFFAFMTQAAPSVGVGTALQIMFGVGGEKDLTERPLPHLRGWRGSQPVRVGNGAWSQRQIDVYGQMLCAAHRLADQIPLVDEPTRRFLVGCADSAAVHWREKDHGIWEIRGEPQHFLHSKVMCWAALDRAIALANRLRATDRASAWRRAAEEIRTVALREGWNDHARAFTQHFESTELDAAVLTMPVVGFLPADDPRMLATVDAIEERLTDSRGLVYRYRVHAAAGGAAGGAVDSAVESAVTGAAHGGVDGGVTATVDGLVGPEGTFLLCTFMLAEVLAMSGQLDRARATFERAAAHANDLGLLAEEVDPSTGELLGNFPQAFSHIGLVNAAWAISEAGKAGGAPAVSTARARGRS